MSIVTTNNSDPQDPIELKGIEPTTPPLSRGNFHDNQCAAIEEYETKAHLLTSFQNNSVNLPLEAAK